MPSIVMSRTYWSGTGSDEPILNAERAGKRREEEEQGEAGDGDDAPRPYCPLL